VDFFKYCPDFGKRFDFFFSIIYNWVEIIRQTVKVVRLDILKMMLKIDFLTFKVWVVVLPFQIRYVKETVHMAGLRTITDHAAVLEKTGG
jgi:hypothetical protein